MKKYVLYISAFLIFVSCDSFVNENEFKITNSEDIIFQSTSYFRAIDYHPIENNVLLYFSLGIGFYDIAESKFYDLSPFEHDIIQTPHSFSPDGKKILFSVGSELYLIKTDGSQNELILSDEKFSHVKPVSFSPDGANILFNYIPTQQFSKRRIGIVNIATKQARTISEFNGQAVSISPNGELILMYDSNNKGNNQNIWIQSVSGEELKQLTNTDAISYPSFFDRSSTKIFYHEYGKKNQFSSVNLNGLENTAISEFQEGASLTSSSLNNSYVAEHRFSLSNENTSYLIDLDNSINFQISLNRPVGPIVGFTKDNKKIVFTTYYEDTTYLLMSDISKYN